MVPNIGIAEILILGALVLVPVITLIAIVAGVLLWTRQKKNDQDR